VPAVSQAQQRLMGQAYALKKGEIKAADLNSEYREQIEDLAKGMTLKQLEDYAKTSHEKLPKKVKESVTHIPTFAEFVGESSIEPINESGVVITANNIHQDLSNFLTTVVIPKSRRYVNNERDAALLLIDIIKHRYNVK
jgi:hypothetical protein